MSSAPRCGCRCRPRCTSRSWPDASHVDEHVVALDPAWEGLDRVIGRRRDDLTGLHVEQRLVDRTFDAITLEEAFRQAGERMGADVVGGIHGIVDPVERDVLAADLGIHHTTLLDLGQPGRPYPSHSCPPPRLPSRPAATMPPFCGCGE